MEVHVDILKLAQTKEKRERIKWFHARQTFFEEPFVQGFALARLCDHDDARYLVSLFPEGRPKSFENAAAVFRKAAQGGDPRSMCWEATCESIKQGDLLSRSAQLGYAWAQASVARYSSSAIAVPLLLKSVAQGEREGMAMLSEQLQRGKYCPRDEDRARALMLEGALLGDMTAQMSWAQEYCSAGSLDFFVWMRRLSQQVQWDCEFQSVGHLAREQLRLYDEGASGRIVFEIGLAHSTDKREPVEYGQRDARRALLLFRQWCNEAKQSVLCWLWAGKLLGVSKDIRLLIANLLWEDRAVWSETRRTT